MTKSEMELDEQSRCIQEALQGLVSRAPEGWSELRYAYRSTVGFSNSDLEFTMRDGSKEAGTAPVAVFDALDDLRHAMHELEKGTWFTALITADSSLRYRANFDYDSEPHFVPQINAASYLDDMRHFPRTEENTPDWLKRRLAEAQNEAP
ncbi:hypothetical protein QMA61_25800 [Streptomyces coelicoflavus]|uniref:hypothetical protein n=1 Tax=Streptomyces coelicoflavus TaxID=285562 RepID=UPI0024AD0170|nr:hypothetical protein [Streptomyces coelicoflavus]MDI6519605.1 hypothetical protein [Streptomyces coelicoflavus]